MTNDETAHVTGFFFSLLWEQQRHGCFIMTQLYYIQKHEPKFFKVLI